MSMIDRLTGMTDADLKRLQVNAVRLSAGAPGRQQTEAASLVPAIEEELAARADAKAVTKSATAAARRAAAPKKPRVVREPKAPKVPKTASEKADDLVASIDEALARK